MLTKAQVQHIANLARIKMSPPELEKYSQELSSILDYIGQLQKVNTKDILPLAQLASLKNVWHEDSPQKGQYLNQNQVLGNAPEKEGQYIKVKSVF